jgi:hypothetical protein
MVDVSDSHFCTLAYDHVRCLTIYEPTAEKLFESEGPVPELKNPRQVIAGNSFACALDDNGVKCWGPEYISQIPVPQLKNPRQLSAGFCFVCALDDEGVKCWGESGQEAELVPNLKNPRQVSAGHSHYCVLDDRGVKCWGDNKWGQVSVPLLKNPRQIVTYDDTTCALTEEGVKCWGFLAEFMTYPKLKNPRQISLGKYALCILDDEGVKCKSYGFRDDDLAVPPLRNPRQVSVGYKYACALDDDGYTCWRIQELTGEKSPWRISLSLFDALKTNSTASHRAFYNELFSEAGALENNVEGIESKYLFYSLLKPAIESTQSEYFESTLISQYRAFVDRLAKDNGFSEISALNDSGSNRQVVLKQIRAAIRVSLEYLTPNQKEELQPIIRLLGIAGSDPSNVNINAVLRFLKHEKPLLAQMRNSAKTEFLADSIELAFGWLEKKVL